MLKAAFNGAIFGAVYMAAHTIAWQWTKRRIARKIQKRFK